MKNATIAFKRTLNLAVIIPLAAMLLLALLLAWQISRLLLTAQRVEHSDAVIAQASYALRLMVDQETGQRGYLVGGDRKFLEPFTKGEQNTPAVLETLAQLVASDAQQTQTVQKIRKGYGDWLKVAHEEMRDVTDGHTNKSLFNQGIAKRYMDAERDRFTALESHETVLRSERNRAARSAATLTLGTAIGASLCLGSVLGVLTRNRLHDVASTYSHALETEQQARRESEAARLQVEAKSREVAAKSEEVARLNAELEQRVADRTAQLEATNKELEAFAYSVSHDLRAPLRSIDGFSAALQEDYSDTVDEMGQTYLNRIRANSRQMGDLIDGLLTLSRLTRADMRIETVDLSAIAQDVAAALRESDPERAVEFKIASGVSVRGDSRLLRNVLENLMGNAWKFTAHTPNPMIEFGATDQEGKKACFMRDNGAGFDMKYQNKLFGAFQRLHGAHEFEGTGIGLATVQRIIRRHGGNIWAEGQVGQGATFTFTLDAPAGTIMSSA